MTAEYVKDLDPRHQDCCGWKLTDQELIDRGPLERADGCLRSKTPPACFVPELAGAVEALNIQRGDAEPYHVRAVAGHLRGMMTKGAVHQDAFDDLLANIAHDLDEYAQASEPRLAP